MYWLAHFSRLEYDLKISKRDSQYNSYCIIIIIIITLFIHLFI